MSKFSKMMRGVCLGSSCLALFVPVCDAFEGGERHNFPSFSPVQSFPQMGAEAFPFQSVLGAGYAPQQAMQSFPQMSVGVSPSQFGGGAGCAPQQAVQPFPQMSVGVSPSQFGGEAGSAPQQAAQPFPQMSVGVSPSQFGGGAGCAPQQSRGIFYGLERGADFSSFQLPYVAYMQVQAPLYRGIEDFRPMEKRSFYSGGGPVSPQFQRADPQALYPVPLNQPIRDYYQFQRNGFSPNPHYKEQVKVELQDYLGERIKKIEDRQTKMEREKKEKEVQEKKKELQEKERIRKQREKALEARNKQLAAENMRLKKLVPNQFKRL